MSPEQKDMHHLEQAAYNAGISSVPFSTLIATVRHHWAKGITKAHDDNQKAAAKDGNINRNTLHRMLEGE